MNGTINMNNIHFGSLLLSCGLIMWIERFEREKFYGMSAILGHSDEIITIGSKVRHTNDQYSCQIRINIFTVLVVTNYIHKSRLARSNIHKTPVVKTHSKLHARPTNMAFRCFIDMNRAEKHDKIVHRYKHCHWMDFTVLWINQLFQDLFGCLFRA